VRTRQQLCESSGLLGRVALSGGWREAVMGVSGNDVGTVEGNPQGHPARRFGAVNHLDAQMVVADGVCDAMSHDSDVSGVELIGYVVRGSPD
jgi:hypothetical protein